MKKLGQALNKFANGVAWVSFVGVAFLMLLNVADVVMNKLTGQSILGAYEISQSTLMCTVFASFAYGQVHKTHIHMTLLIELTNGAVSDILHYSVAPFYYIEAVCMIVFMIVLLYDTILSLMAIFKGECAQEISSHW